MISTWRPRGGTFPRSRRLSLLNAGATVDLKNKFGNTPLFTAAFNSRERGEIIKLLRDAGADPRVENVSGQTPLGLAHLIANYDVKQFFSDLRYEG